MEIRLAIPSIYFTSGLFPPSDNVSEVTAKFLAHIFIAFHVPHEAVY